MFYVRGLLQNLHTLLIILCFMFKDFLINLAVLFLYMEVSRKKSPETKKTHSLPNVHDVINFE
jgi:hypothetical protein